LLTAAHAAAPWKYPKLYPEPWLEPINENHTHFSADVRAYDGSMMSQIELRPKVYYHPKRDLAVLHFEEEQDAMDVMRLLGIDYNLELTDEDQVKINQQLYFYGHEVEDAPFKDYTIDRKRWPFSSTGQPLYRTPYQVFSKTKDVLPNGMCGGPVLTTEKVEKEYRKIVCGIVEGIVPSSNPVEKLRQTAVFVEAREIREFLNAIEENQVKPLEGNGYAQLMVGADQDPAKMDLAKIIDG
jgi:hypothetical protein